MPYIASPHTLICLEDRQAESTKGEMGPRKPRVGRKVSSNWTSKGRRTGGRIPQGACRRFVARREEQFLHHLSSIHVVICACVVSCPICAHARRLQLALALVCPKWYNPWQVKFITFFTFFGYWCSGKQRSNVFGTGPNRTAEQLQDNIEWHKLEHDLHVNTENMTERAANK